MRMLNRRVVLAAVAMQPIGCASTPMRVRSDLVQTYDAERQAALYGDGPIVALYERGGRTLGWIAAVHGPTPDTPTAQLVRDAISALKPRIVLLEGFPTAWGENPDRVIRRVNALPPNEGDEGDVAVRAAITVGADIWGGEPTDAQLAAALAAQGYAPGDVFFAALLGPLEQDQRNGEFDAPEGAAFDAAFNRLAHAMAPSYAAPTPTRADFEAWFQTRFGVSLKDDPEWFTRGWPGRDGIGAEIARASNRLRDVHAYSTVIALLSERRSVVVVFGGSHLSSVWAALEHGFGRPRLLRRV